uniref:Putative secreted protein n=1 Tax=Ixodes ricinus TaxID=34613 RepID=A0A6B0UTD3_IXORI
MLQACPSIILSSCLLLRLAVGLRRRRIPHKLPRACNARANQTVYRHSHGRMRTTGRSLCRPSLQRELATFDDETWASRKLRACTRSHICLCSCGQARASRLLSKQSTRVNCSCLHAQGTSRVGREPCLQSSIDF